MVLRPIEPTPSSAALFRRHVLSLEGKSFPVHNQRFSLTSRYRRIYKIGQRFTLALAELMARKRPPQKQRSPKVAAAALEKVRAIAFAMEEPLNEAMNFVVALRLIGDGLSANHDDDGRAVYAIAWAASERIETLKEKWKGIFRAARGRAGRGTR
jgi:hypothetical protein